MNVELARKCKNLRRKSRLSYRQFANICGLRIETIKEYEKGILSIPTKVLEQYAKLAEKN